MCSDYSLYYSMQETPPKRKKRKKRKHSPSSSSKQNSKKLVTREERMNKSLQELQRSRNGTGILFGVSICKEVEAHLKPVDVVSPLTQLNVTTGVACTAFHCKGYAMLQLQIPYSSIEKENVSICKYGFYLSIIFIKLACE